LTSIGQILKPKLTVEANIEHLVVLAGVVSMADAVKEAIVAYD
jgi:hypothetical protein